MFRSRFIFTVLALAMLSLYSCSRGDDLTGIEMPYRYQFDVPAGLNPLNTHFFERSGILTNAQNIIGSIDDINRIIPYRASLTSLDNVDYAFIREVEVRVRHRDNPGLEIPVFYREEIPANIGGRIDLIATQANVTDILSLDDYNVIVEFKLYSTSGQTFESDLQISFLAQ